MKSQSNKAQSACDVKIYSDKGSLALRFPIRHNAFWEALDGKSLKGKPKCLGIGKYGFSADNSDDWKRAASIAIAMEADLDHPEWEKLFDRTLAKYGLGGGKYAKLAEIIQLPGTAQAQPEITVGEMWEAYLEWKKSVIEETTFKARYQATYTNAILGRVWDGIRCKYSQSSMNLGSIHLDSPIAINSALIAITISHKVNLIFSLNESFAFCKAKGLLKVTTENPFVADKYSAPVVTTQQKYVSKIVNGEEKQWHEITDENALEDDRRAFSKIDRDTIIKAFYDARSPSAKALAQLIEFYFLTGCRTSEALSLTWSDIDLERHIIRFSKSLGRNTRKIKQTKTGEARLFYFSENSRLRELLLDAQSKDLGKLVFPGRKGSFQSTSSIGDKWRGDSKKNTLADGTEKTYHYPGVVTQLVRDGVIHGYLSPYHTRHTYITLTAHANAHNNNALLHIASACGNSVDVILRHYLGVAESVELVEV